MIDLEKYKHIEKLFTVEEEFRAWVKEIDDHFERLVQENKKFVEWYNSLPWYRKLWFEIKGYFE